MDAVEQAIKMKRELLERIEIVGEKLPPNTLDELIDCLGGPDNVAEVNSLFVPRRFEETRKGDYEIASVCPSVRVFAEAISLQPLHRFTPAQV